MPINDVTRARVEEFRGVAAAAASDAETSRLVEEAWDLLDVVLQRYNGISNAETNINRIVDNLRAIFPSPSARQLLLWVDFALGQLNDVFENAAGYAGLTAIQLGELTTYRARCANAKSAVTLAVDRLTIADQKERAARALQAAENSARLAEAAAGVAVTSSASAEVSAHAAQESAGITADASFVEHFSLYARREWWSANVFRLLSISCIIGGLLYAVFGKHPGADDWVGLAIRLAALAGLGALAAYFARQGGQHRRIYNWARSMEVQLRSFQAFTERMPEDVRDDAYRFFSRRVFGAPPEKGSESSDETVPAAQLVDLALAAMRRTQ